MSGLMLFRIAGIRERPAGRHGKRAHGRNDYHQRTSSIS